MSHDIEDSFSANVSGHRRPGLLAHRLITAFGVEGQLAEDRAVLGDTLTEADCALGCAQIVRTDRRAAQPHCEGWAIV